MHGRRNRHRQARHVLRRRCRVRWLGRWKFEKQFIKVSKGIEGVLEYDGGGGGRVEGTNSGKTSRCGRMVAAATPDCGGFLKSGNLLINMLRTERVAVYNLTLNGVELYAHVRRPGRVRQAEAIGEEGGAKMRR